MKIIHNKKDVPEKGYWVTTQDWFIKKSPGFYYTYHVNNESVYLAYGSDLYRYEKIEYRHWIFWTDEYKNMGYEKREYEDSLEMENKHWRVCR